MTGIRVVGLDLSLTSTGVSDGRSHHAFQTTNERSIEARLDEQTQNAIGFVLAPSPWMDGHHVGMRADVVLIEGSSYGSRGPGHEELAALRYMVRVRLHRLFIPFAIVPPTTLKLYTAGDGKATKPEMVKAIQDRHGVDLTVHKVKDGRYDMADAYALAALGYARIGQPLPTTGPVPDAPASDIWPLFVPLRRKDLS